MNNIDGIRVITQRTSEMNNKTESYTEFEYTYIINIDNLTVKQIQEECADLVITVKLQKGEKVRTEHY